MEPRRSRDRRFERQIQTDTHDLYIPNNASELAKECGQLFKQGRFEEGMHRARRVTDFDANAIAQRQVAIGHSYMGNYPRARRHFYDSLALTPERETETRANCMANIGTTFLEEWDLDNAQKMYDQALQIDPRNVFGLLGCVAVACQHTCIDQLEYTLWMLIDRRSDWKTEGLIVQTLLRDRSFRFLREQRVLFESILGLDPETLAKQYVEGSLAAVTPDAKQSDKDGYAGPQEP